MAVRVLHGRSGLATSTPMPNCYFHISYLIFLSRFNLSVSDQIGELLKFVINLLLVVSPTVEYVRLDPYLAFA
ncbi:hypothetical protein J6590_021501 [Homalodisca vitripennis]|nr:hypothetical protein J6590_021501 [Homalodisca vitripennis]